MSTTIRNEAVDLMMDWVNAQPNKEARRELGYLFGKALAAERAAGRDEATTEAAKVAVRVAAESRRATVERIRLEIRLSAWAANNPKSHGYREVLGILDEEAAR